MKYIILSIISALLLSISWPTYGVPFFIFIALVPLLKMEHEISKFSKIRLKSLFIFGLSYFTFLIWNIVTTGWLYGSKNPDGTNSLMAVLFPVLVNSLLYSLVFISYHIYKKYNGTYWGLAFLIAIWITFEKFHLTWEFTWPWLNLGNVFSEYPKIIQWYDTFGATGGCFWILLINIFCFYTIRIWEAGRKRKDLIKNLVILAIGVLVPMIVSLIKYYKFNEKPIGYVSALLLQPSLDPYQEKYSKDSIQILQELLQLAEKYPKKTFDYYISPETSLPGSGSISEGGLEKSTLLNKIRNFLQSKEKSTFIGGISSHRFFLSSESLPKAAYKTSQGIWVVGYNSAIQLVNGEKTEVYHKGKLVPGVEIFPYKHILKPILGEAMLNFGGTVASLGTDTERKVFQNPYNKGIAAPIICYESIYGEFVTEYVKNGANFLSIMSNDSWWGKTQGHQQLISYSRLRAIETRREIARAANSGISAHINAIGEIEESTFYEDCTALPVKIRLYNVETFYTKTGDLVSRICIFFLGFLIFYPIVLWFKNKSVK